MIEIKQSNYIKMRYLDLQALDFSLAEPSSQSKAVAQPFSKPTQITG